MTQQLDHIYGYMREDAQNQSLHYVQMCAVKDRIDYSSVPDSAPSSTRNIFDIPSSDDYAQLKKNLAIHVARILVEHVQCFNEDFKDLVTKHILHKYSDQMCTRLQYMYSTALVQWAAPMAQYTRALYLRMYM